jgi:hypothetical protein
MKKKSDNSKNRVWIYVRSILIPVAVGSIV